MKIKHLDHLNMTVANLSESIVWYRDVFGFDVRERGVRNGTPWAIIQSGEAILCMYEDASRSGPQQFLKRGGDAHTIYHFGLRITDRLPSLFRAVFISLRRRFVRMPYEIPQFGRAHVRAEMSNERMP